MHILIECHCMYKLACTNEPKAQASACSKLLEAFFFYLLLLALHDVMESRYPTPHIDAISGTC